MKIGDQSLLLYHYICISANHLITGNIFYIPVSKNISMKRSLVLFQTSRGYHFSVQGLLLFSILCVYFCHEILGNFLKSSKILDGLVGLRDSITPAMKRAFILRKRCPKLGSKKLAFIGTDKNSFKNAFSSYYSICIKYGLVRAKHGLEIRVGVLHILETSVISIWSLQLQGMQYGSMPLLLPY